MNLGIIIPARFDSARLPGKPLLPINGKPMIQHTWERCCLALDPSKVFVATDDMRIKSVVSDFGGLVVMTSKDCLTGTDRVAEANLMLQFDLVINVQGDEPLIDPRDITKMIAESVSDPGKVLNGMAEISVETEFFSRSVPKVAFNNAGELLYMSRSPIPGSKLDGFNFGYKQICIYAFPSLLLQNFSGSGRKGKFEIVEDIEILRFIEMGIAVKMVDLDGNNIAVDTPEDYERVLRLVNK